MKKEKERPLTGEPEIDFYKLEKVDKQLEEYEKAVKKVVIICRECENNEKGFCRMHMKWCSNARLECDKFGHSA